MQFKLTDLLWCTAYFAVGAWLYSLGAGLGLMIWLGMVLGFEVGSRSDYPTILLTICGIVFGLALAMAVFLTADLISNDLAFVMYNYAAARIALVVITWLVAAGIFIWLVSRLMKRSGQTLAKPIRAGHASK
jgi:formate/nitrite transporter FocA (FNT family)